MHVADFDYELPPELIAQRPAERRRESRLLVLERGSGEHHLHGFAEFPNFLRPGDCLVLNDTRVIPARIFGRKESGGQVEALLLQPRSDGTWEALLRPGRRLRPGTRIALEAVADETFTVVERLPEGCFAIRFASADVLSLLDRVGHVPLPPYIQRQDAVADRERYQTVYAREPGAVAAPTAGLHFDEAMLAELETAGVQLVRLTLHVGLGTFRPVEVDRVEEHVMHSERYSLSPAAADTINAARAAGGRVVAVGTTSVRVLETCATADGGVEPGSGETDIFLYPPHQPRAVDGLLTNFHLPRSTLLMLVCTFAPRRAVLDAYRTAVAERLRFYSYGDCMLLM